MRSILKIKLSTLFAITVFFILINAGQSYASDYAEQQNTDFSFFITTQPNDVIMPVSCTAVFNVEASGVNLKHQWQTSKDNGKTWSNSSMPGNDTPVLNVEVIEPRNGYRFRCLITSHDCTVLSDIATLTVGESSIPITKQPENITCTIGRTAFFTIEVDGTDISYQWQTSKDGGHSWSNSNLPGNKTNCLMVDAVESRNNYQFRCVVMEKNVGKISDISSLTVIKDTTPDDITDLQLTYYDRSDMIWSYSLSMNPIVISYSGLYDKIYWGYTTCDGYSGVASYDLNTGETVKTHLKYGETDDHNNTSVFMKDGHIVVSYTTGHNTGNVMNYRVSSEVESIESFQPVYQYYSNGKTCYGQFFDYNDILYSFFRHDNQNWHCLASYDSGYTWGDEKRIINANMQYYCKFQETTTDGLLRLCMYSNPSSDDPSIRMGFLNLNDGTIYNSDAITVLGNWEQGVQYSEFDQIIVPEYTQRLFDVAVTAPQDISLLICHFSMNLNDDGVYLWYKNGEYRKICNAGESFWHPKYQNGMVFFGNDKVLLSRSDNIDVPKGKDYIEIWNLGDIPSLDKTIYSEEKGIVPTRNIRPIVDTNKNVILWQRGYYDPYSYTHFRTDTMIYLIHEDYIAR